MYDSRRKIRHLVCSIAVRTSLTTKFLNDVQVWPRLAGPGGGGGFVRAVCLNRKVTCFKASWMFIDQSILELLYILQQLIMKWNYQTKFMFV
jgi:hypothetical protein